MLVQLIYLVSAALALVWQVKWPPCLLDVVNKILTRKNLIISSAAGTALSLKGLAIGMMGWMELTLHYDVCFIAALISH